MRYAAVLVCVVLGACASGPSEGERAAAMEVQDDAACRKLVADQGKANQPNAYQQCRQNLVMYRQMDAQRRAQEQAEAADWGSRLQRAGCALQRIDRPGLSC